MNIKDRLIFKYFQKIFKKRRIRENWDRLSKSSDDDILHLESLDLRYFRLAPSKVPNKVVSPPSYRKMETDPGFKTLFSSYLESRTMGKVLKLCDTEMRKGVHATIRVAELSVYFPITSTWA
jgi:hypothetical protein